MKLYILWTNTGNGWERDGYGATDDNEDDAKNRVKILNESICDAEFCYRDESDGAPTHGLTIKPWLADEQETDERG
jgi:hypothetical protein